MKLLLALFLTLGLTGLAAAQESTAIPVEPNLEAAPENLPTLDTQVTGNQTLGEILELAVAGSEELNILTTRMRQSVEGLGEARANYYPQVTVSERVGRDAAYPSAARTPSDPRGQSEYVNANTTKLEINQMLFDGFKTPAEVARQEKLLEALTQRYRTTRQQVVKDTLDVYLTAWRHLQALRAGVAMVEDMTALKRKVDLQAEAGATDQTVKSYVDSRLTGATQELLKTRNAYREALFRLGYLLQRDVTPESFTFAPLLAPKLLELDLYLGVAQTDSPEILEEIANKVAAEYELRKARSGDYPTLSLTSDMQDSNDVGGSVGTQRTGNAMLQLSYKLFDGFATRHGKARVKNQIAEHQYRLRRTTRRLEQDLSQAWRKAVASQQETRLATEEATASLKVKQLRAQDVESGSGDIVRLIEAEEALYTTILRQLDLVQTLTQKRFELSITSGQLKNLACVDGGCADLPMEPVAYVSPVDAAPIPTISAPLVNTADPVSTSVVVSDTSALLPAFTTPPADAPAALSIAAPPPPPPPPAPSAAPENTNEINNDTPRDYEAPTP